MKTLLIGVIAGLLFGVAVGQNSTPTAASGTAPQNTATTQSAPGQAGETFRIAPGSVIPVQLTKTIDAKKAKPGDEVEAKVTQDSKARNGEMIMPKDTKVIGHVTEAQARNKEQKESELGIVFDHAAMKDGSNLAVPMSIQAIIAPLNTGNSGAEDTGQTAPTAGPGGMPAGTSPGRMPGMGGTPPMPSARTSGSDWPAGSQTGTNARPPITESTQGVVGISNLKLSPPANGTQGSVLSSEKNNVKLDSGTLMLLRVNP